MDNKLTGGNIKRLRTLEKITQQQLADSIGKTESTIRKYEKGLIEIPISVLEKIAAVLNIDVNAILGITPKPEEMAQDLSALACLLYSSNCQLERISQGYTLACSEGTDVITEDDVDNLLNITKEFLEFNANKLIKVKMKENLRYLSQNK